MKAATQEIRVRKVEKHFHEGSAELQIPPRHAGTGRLPRDDKGEVVANFHQL
jgi:hypothetical protein